MAKDNKKAGNPNPLIVRSMEEVMHNSMMPYAEYVILDRAIPRVEDGLKPVQRRILFTLNELGITPDKPHRKSARIVGDCLGKYHPHGDSSVYDAMVRLAQSFNMSVPLVDGHGNFGSVDGDPAAAMRYTEARMAPAALELLRDLEKDTVSFSLNFDDSLKEPDVLPARFPNLLVNGASGIAVGLATNIPPHNLGEAIDATIAMLDDPDISLQKVMKKLKGPDFPTHGYFLQDDSLLETYRTGRGRLVMRARTHFEEQKNGRTLLVIDELPYQVNKAHALEKILKLTEDKKNLFAGISNIRDESDRKGMRAVVEMKKGVDGEKMRQLLYKYADLQLNFSMNMVAIAGGKPQQMGVLEVLRHYIRHQKDVVTRRTRYDLEAAEKRAHILEGLIIAIDNIDRVIKLIRASQSPSEARGQLMETFALSEVQAQAILDMRLQRLTALQIFELRKELEGVLAKIAEYRAILGDDQKLVAVIEEEMREIKKRFAQPRRTEIINESPEIIVEEESMEAAEDVVVCMTENGFQRYPAKTYDRMRENGGFDDLGRILFALPTKSNAKLQVFTNYGNMYLLNPQDIREPKGKEKGMLPSSLFQGWQDGEKVLNLFSFGEGIKENKGIFFLTRGGQIKKTGTAEYDTRMKRIAAIKLREGDEVQSIWLDNGGDSILCISKKGMSIRFAADSVPENGRVTAGVKAMALGPGDAIIHAVQWKEELGEVVVISDRGYAKRSLLLDYDIQGRNGKGLKTFDFRKTGANGTQIAGALVLCGSAEIVIKQALGEETRLRSDEIWMEPRFSKGQPLVAALLDDVVTEIYVLDGQENNV